MSGLGALSIVIKKAKRRGNWILCKVNGKLVSLRQALLMVQELDFQNLDQKSVSLQDSFGAD